MTLDLQKGDAWPFRSSRGLTGAPCKPAWYALITAPMKEKDVRHRLQNSGVVVKYPTRTKVWHQHGKKRTLIQPVIPRIIYARFRYEPNWEVLRERRVIVGVMSRESRPIELTADDIARVMGLPTEEERQQAAQKDALRPRAGERAEIVLGPLKGFFVDVTAVRGGQVWFETLTGIKGATEEKMLRRSAS